MVVEEGGFLQEGAISGMISGAVGIMVAGAMEEMILETGASIQAALAVISGLIKTVGRAEGGIPVVGWARQAFLPETMWMVKLGCGSYQDE